MDTDVVRIVGEVMGEVLGTRPIGPRDGFFQCGGDSVLAVRAVDRLVERFARPSLRSALLVAVFDGAGPADLAPLLSG